MGAQGVVQQGGHPWRYRGAYTRTAALFVGEAALGMLFLREGEASPQPKVTRAALFASRSGMGMWKLGRLGGCRSPSRALSTRCLQPGTEQPRLPPPLPVAQDLLLCY